MRGERVVEGGVFQHAAALGDGQRSAARAPQLLAQSRPFLALGARRPALAHGRERGDRCARPFLLPKDARLTVGRACAHARVCCDARARACEGKGRRRASGATTRPMLARTLSCDIARRRPTAVVRRLDCVHKRALMFFWRRRRLTADRQTRRRRRRRSCSSRVCLNADRHAAVRSLPRLCRRLSFAIGSFCARASNAALLLPSGTIA